MALKGNAKPQGALCSGHLHGYAPGAPRPYVATCRVCVFNRGHLPEGERDRPASAAFKDAKASRGLFGYGRKRVRFA
jgi:hypothetical protein